MHSLHALTTATRALGIPAGVERPAVKSLIERYGEEVSQMDGWKELGGTACAQAVVDLAWVNVVLGRGVRGEEVDRMLDKVSNVVRPLSNGMGTVLMYRPPNTSGSAWQNRSIPSSPTL